MTLNENENNLLKELFPTLTNRQLEVMKDFSLGMTTSQLQTKANCSRTAIEKHLADLRAEFGCTSSNEIRTIFLNNIVIRVLQATSINK
ncbi:helix-turn-helix transcriptional regulator [Shewanella xiamenensis]|jgi:DNA-binding CsgD family transcriptional regulator|uniref:helix-turn-helix transcriptional regulator n=1 Tax=Shewanella xiamenensis TaxID=332186 RepID=UPI003F19A382